MPVIVQPPCACPAGQVCAPSGFTVDTSNLVCVFACVTDVDCRAGDTCDNASGLCSSTGAYPSCTTDSECGTGAICDDFYGECVIAMTRSGQACTSDADCAVSDFCGTTAGVCMAVDGYGFAPCANNSQCGPAELCDPRTSTCALCQQGPCKTAADCPCPGTSCEAATSTCTAPTGLGP